MKNETAHAKTLAAFHSVFLVAALAMVVSVTMGAWAADTNSTPAKPDAPAGAVPAAPVKAQLPRLVDLGAGKCIPCKKMAPILEALKKEYAGKFDVVFIDVWQNKQEAEKYNINLIPTQIFFDAAGNEKFRHEGFFSKEDILAKWKELGVDVGQPAAAEPVQK